MSDPQAPSHDCSDWAEIVRCLEQFPSPEVNTTEGEVTRTAWVFRGLANSSFCLEPAIERQACSKDMPWPALERLVALEFKVRARMHLSAAMVPEDEFTWLAQMQHYGVPTRLLDFTYSPFVALYFAVRQQFNEKRSHVRLWAINEAVVNERFLNVAWRAKAKASELAGKKEVYKVASLNPDSFSRVGDNVVDEVEALWALISESLLATGTFRAELERQGCVAVASPPGFNPRLASQQGLFLVNCAGELDFCESLNKMMAKCKVDWCKRFDIPSTALSSIEQRLFQMNIHEQSLFPDMEGLAGFIRQKLRLHWG